ncbi:hypothetical protein [Sulfolobus acidocaldarius]|nr:hypothetical protein [Sulfolobus acidocaldarius]AGE70454.1 conjugative plasmid protein [Sulfolobus acidocaldarius N8]AGE72728.1 conjugative plasmid protein [Sulfolobus acidocaldarius Ron12/I]ALU29165.1 conjugal transfer protein [Sulfolobus acidocaldarius]ALU31890.1 conjugal transfer protein [Sulfolobus acidocaldarius]WCM34448.1 conjugal transfer protein [Sulfolobus acidocaldarius DSM 639]
MVEQIIEFPDVMKQHETYTLPDVITDPDGKPIMYPKEEIGKNPIVVNRKNWRLFANFDLVRSKGKEIVVRIKTTGQLVRIRDMDAATVMYYVERIKPGATVHEAITYDIQKTIEETGDFEEDGEFMFYMWQLFVVLSYLIQYGVLILVK